jgi:hypothetical protein
VLGYNKKYDLYEVAIPNKELMIVWKQWILRRIYKSSSSVRSIYQNLEDTEQLAHRIKNVFTDALSYNDLAVYNDDPVETWERIYHVFLLGLLAGNLYDKTSRRILSNRESGDGRYDVLVETDQYSLIFEFKATSSGDKDALAHAATQAVKQIQTKRYDADIAASQTVIAIGVAVYKKRAEVVCIKLR